MATKNTTADFTEFVLSLRDLCNQFLGDTGTATKAAAADDDDEDEAPAVESTGYSEAALKTMPIKKLRELAIAEGFEEDEVADAKKSELVEALLADDDDADEDEADEDDEDTDEAEDADEDDSEEDEDAEAEAEREELMGLSLAKLRKSARDDYNATAAELKGLDKEGIVDLILGADAEDDSDVDVDEEGEDEDGYTEDELQDMELDELREILDEWEVEYSAKARKATLVKLVLEAQEWEDEDEDEDDE